MGRLLKTVFVLAILVAGGLFAYRFLTDNGVWFDTGDNGAHASFYKIGFDHTCKYATGQDTVCELTLTNDPSSSDGFDWEASSSPAVATIEPDSGSLALGSTSDKLTVTLPYQAPCPVTLIFTDTGHNGRVTYDLNTIPGGHC